MFFTRAARTRRIALAGLAGALALSMSACARSQRDAGAGATGGTLTFGAAGAPKMFDPIFNDEGETDRIVRQMYDTLVGYAPDSTQVVPDLATKWTPSPDGKDWTFELRQGVKFSDGTPFDAAAVCFNYDRWYNMSGAAAQTQMTYYGDIFEGFAHNAGDATGQPLYKSCEAKGDYTAVIHLNHVKGAFPDAFGLTSFAISSPTALKQYDADKVVQNGDSFEYSPYANLHPTGTGAFKFESYDRQNQTVTLVRNDDYWGPKPALDRIVFKIIPDETARKQELLAGTIDGYDLPSPVDYPQLRSAGMNLQLREPFNLLYLGINQKNTPALKDLRVRQAIAYAIDRDRIVKTKMPERATVAKEFMPPAVKGYADDVMQYPYDPDKARQLLQQAGAANLNLKFYYPTQVTRPYMPNPQDLAAAMADDLKAVGIRTTLVAEPWNGGYKDDVQKFGKHDLHLLGWNGDYGDAGNWIGTFFGRQKAEFGFDAPALFDEIGKADATIDPAAHAAAYQQANRDIMANYLPAVPILHTPAGIVVSSKVKGVVPSPLNNEHFDTWSMG